MLLTGFNTGKAHSLRETSKGETSWCGECWEKATISITEACMGATYPHAGRENKNDGDNYSE